VESLVARTQLGLIAFEEVQMSYRNDHDAALNRVAALERELATLKGEPKGTKENEEDEDELRVSEHGGEHKLMGVLVGGAAAICASSV
jgi:ferric-dicitrate binding protein FerR (iron transport regulator)